MTHDNPQSAADDTIHLFCECGARLSVPRDTDHAVCDCGATYAVTVTQLRSSTD